MSKFIPRFINIYIFYIVSADNMMVRPFKLMDFKMEIVLVSTFIAYVFAWYKGKALNMSKAKNWLNGQIEFLQSQFALVGDKKTNDKSILMMDGPADYLLYTSGRRHVQFGHWWLKLKPRNDPLTFFTTTLLSMIGYAKPVSDRVSLKLHLDKALSDKFVFAVIKKDLSDELYKNRFDLKRVAKIASSKIIPENQFIIYSETQKLADLILNSKVGEIINQNLDRLQSFIISSLPSEEPERFESDGYISLHLDFLMPDTSNVLDPYVKLACFIPDFVSQLRLTSDIKSKINKNREEIVKEFSKKIAADRAEELAKKKAEAKRAEEERIKKLSPAEQRKWEEKERLRNLKKQQKKRRI
ncbi:uncharacterized protein BX663DRAFT_508162 [Cokeromyces recurvatus]|uniref:uncharacterized protein n=1 Tax=Cokeromyces recurvatus TaxID=90255 RepID=UPI00221F2132|nr:uncharacterized protein BX663DRAFT_508162 [Cokeromyces recurvatus]KAI7903303.1 hypothetical protein BX663DRAFT_508162 [Cokeromyces recurvatus]